MKFSAVVVALALFASANAVPLNKRQAKPFAHDNGVAAQKLNDEFSKLTPDSPCTDGQNACVKGGFAQCVGGKFAITQCAGGTSCFALPLVNKAGTSITCTTKADADARIATALGTPTGGGDANPSPSPSPSPSSPAASPTPKPKPKPAASGKGCSTVRSCNAKDAIKLANDFKKLNENSSCTSGQNACVKGKFAQCVNGKFQTTACSGGTKCQVLPLVNSRGTSITCDTDADAQFRIDDALKN